MVYPSGLLGNSEAVLYLLAVCQPLPSAASHCVLHVMAGVPVEVKPAGLFTVPEATVQPVGTASSTPTARFVEVSMLVKRQSISNDPPAEVLTLVACVPLMATAIAEEALLPLWHPEQDEYLAGHASAGFC